MTRKTYDTAQRGQSFSELQRYGTLGPDALITIRCIAVVLGIRLQMVSKIPVQRVTIDKRGYYRKGDIHAWMEEDLSKPDSLLYQLRAEHRKTQDRQREKPSSRYSRSYLGKEEVVEAKSRSETNVLSEPSEYERLYWPKVGVHVERLREKNKS